METELKLVDVFCGLPDEPVVPEQEKTSFICPQGIRVSDVDITSKNNTYTLKCTINGKRQPKQTLTEEESRWVDAGVVGALEMAVRVNRKAIDKMAAVQKVKTLFD